LSELKEFKKMKLTIDKILGMKRKEAVILPQVMMQIKILNAKLINCDRG
jgi:hypothetical protein